jgi:hypothetical protein
MKTTLGKNTLEFDFSAEAPSLLDQLDTKLTAAEMSRAAACSAGLFEWAADQPATDQADLVAKMPIVSLRNIDTASPDSVTVAVGTAALLMAAKMGPATASERIRRAAGLLSERYQADW